MSENRALSADTTNASPLPPDPRYEFVNANEWTPENPDRQNPPRAAQVGVDYVRTIQERYERLYADRSWPDSQEKARRAVRALLNALKQADEAPLLPNERKQSK